LSPLLNTFCVFNLVGCSFSGSVKDFLSCPPVLCRDSVQLTYAVVRMYLCMYARYHYVLLYYGVRSDHCLNTLPRRGTISNEVNIEQQIIGNQTVSMLAIRLRQT
jgi:hypothetical protein